MKHVYLFICLLILTSITVGGVLPLVTPVASAQEQEQEQQEVIIQNCADKVQWALDATEQLCVDIGDNKICYGHIFVAADSQTAETPLDFDTAGDIADLLAVRTIRLSPMDLENELWGVALMSLIAHQRYASPKPVIFLLFGDVDVENAVDPTATILEVTVANTDDEFLNVRLAPSMNAGALGVLEPGQTVIANGRLADNSWLRITLPETNRIGWASAEFLTNDSGVDQLDVIDRDASYYGPMQAFYFTSGINDAVCPESPQSGMLVQTQEGVAQVTLLVNEVDITLAGTAFMQAEEGGDMTVGILNGWAQVESGGQSQTIFAGTQVGVPIGGDQPGAPGPLETLNLASLGETLRAQIAEEIAIARPLTPGEIDELLNPPTPEPELEVATGDDSTTTTTDGQTTQQPSADNSSSGGGDSSSSDSGSSDSGGDTGGDDGGGDTGGDDGGGDTGGDDGGGDDGGGDDGGGDDGGDDDKNNGVGDGTGGGKDNNRGGGNDK